VLVSRPNAGSEPTEAPFRRLTEEDLRNANTYNLPNHSAPSTNALRELDFARQMDAFLQEEGALAWVRMSQRDGGLLHGTGSGYRMDDQRKTPGMELAAEDYRRLARLALTEDAKPRLELMSEVRFHDEDQRLQHPGRHSRHGSQGRVNTSWPAPTWTAGSPATARSTTAPAAPWSWRPPASCQP
jgi:carboxypeptidase Q